MLFFCECLNVIGKLNAGKARRGSFKINASPSMSLEALEFFKSVSCSDFNCENNKKAITTTTTTKENLSSRTHQQQISAKSRPNSKNFLSPTG